MSKAFSIETPKNGVAILYFDLPGEKVNKFSTPVMEELAALVDSLKSRNDIKVLLLMSRKPGIFIAGADVREIESITDEETGYKVGRKGQQIFTEFERLPFKKVAVIDGACMGGGTELSLCCDFRLASDHPKTKIALPEVNLGILPGWGGTQRLPRLIGLQRALDVILTGRNLVPRQAYKYAIVDKIIPHEWVLEKALEFADEIMAGKTKKYIARRKPKGAVNLALEKTPFGRNLIFSQAKKNVLKKTGGHYPAPLLALEVVRKTYGMPLEKGLDEEAKALGKLIATTISKNLIRIFFWTEEIKKENGVDDPEIQGQPVRKAAVLGAGVMGGGIAQLFASKGIPVRVKDINYQAVAKAYQQAAEVLGGKVKRRRLTKLEFQQIMNRITGTVDYSGFGNVDLVVEAIIEDLDVKKQVLSELEEKIPAEAVIATNTSSLRVDDMAEALKESARFAGMHFFNPVHRMPLVEVVRGKNTSDEAVATVFNLAKKLGKTPILVNDGPGFLVNRLLLPYMVEAISLLEQGNTIQAVDDAMKHFGMPMGPIELFDEVGLDVALKVAKILQKTMGDRMAESDILEKLVEDNRLGKKTGVGFYKYNGKKKEYDSAVENYITIKNPVKLDEQNLIKRMVYPMINEAARCLDEGLVKKPRDVDVGMIFGTGFAPFRGGLLTYADTIGLEEVVRTLNEFSEQYGARFKPSKSLLKYEKKGKFYGN